jgi:protocatechuate 3,4-dioxygenase beta subunit
MQARRVVPPHGAGFGRIEVLVGFLVAAAIVSAFIYYSLDRPGDAPRPDRAPVATPAEKAPEAEVAQPQPELPAGGESEAPGSTNPVAAEEPLASSGPAGSISKQPIHGKVLNVAGEPVPGICVRWLQARASELARFRNDRKALGKDGEAARFPAGELRAAFEKSVAAETAADGAYALETKREAGVLVVSGPGYTMELRDVEAASEGSPEPSVDETPPETAAGETAPVNTARETPPAGAVEELESDFTLDFASAISGTVVEHGSGEPAALVVVQVGTIDPNQPAILSFVGSDAPSAVSGSDGTYEIQGLKPGEYRVVARSGWSGYLGSASNEALRVVVERGEDRNGVDLEVTRGGTISGRVVDPTGEPVAGARCELLSSQSIAAAMKGDVESQLLLGNVGDTADDEGRFELGGIPFGEGYCVVARREGFAPARSEPPVAISAARPIAETSVRLAAGSSISGRVVRTDGGPAGGVKVSDLGDFSRLMAADLDAMVRGVVATETDDDGAFVIEHLAPGKYELVVGKFKAEELFSSKPKTTTVVLDGSGDREGIVLVLNEPADEESGRISGLVADDLGQPVADANIRFAMGFDFAGVSASSARSGADGRFEVAKLNAGTFRVTASKAGHADAVVGDVAAGTLDLRVTLERFARVHGKVLRVDGSAPAGGGKVRALRAGADTTTEKVMTARMSQLTNLGKEDDAGAGVDPDGNFTLSAPPGEVEVIATVPGHAPAASETLRLAAGEERGGVEIVVTAGATLHGRVTLGGASPVAGAKVHLNRVHADGKRDYFSELMPEFFGKAGETAVSGEEGYFEIPHLAPGKYAVKATHDAYASTDAHEVKVDVDQTRKVPDLVLKVGSRLVGRVLQDGQGKPGMMAQLIGEAGMKQGFTSLDGRFEFKGLREGAYLLNVMDLAAMAKQRWVLRSRAVTVVEGADAEVELVFGIGRKVSGKIEGLQTGLMTAITLRRPGGLAPEEVDPLDIKAYVESARHQAGVTLAAGDGPYEIADVESGEYVLEVVKVPANPADWETYSEASRVPLFRKEVTVRDRDLELDIRVR